MDEPSLLEVFEALRGSPDALATLPDLPPELLSEAVASYADTAPPEVAEHLAPAFLDGVEPGETLGLLTSAPSPTWVEDDLLPDLSDEPFPADDPPFGHDDPLFGDHHGHDTHDAFDLPDHDDPGDDWLDL